MKVEIIKKFSVVYLTDRFYVYVNKCMDESYESLEAAQKRIDEIREAFEKTNQKQETVFTENF